jgi:hypothetical protein
LPDRIVKLAAAHNPADADLSGDIGEAGDYDYRDALFFDLFGDRSAATTAGSSGGG